MVSAGASPGKKIAKKDWDEATPTQAAVLGDMILGFSYSQIHRKYGIVPDTAKRWAYQFSIKKPPAPIGANKPIPKDNRITLMPRQDIGVGVIPNPSRDVDKPMGEQIVDYLRLSFETLGAQLKVAGDPNYIKRQNAHDLATLHKIIGDRAVELANALLAGERGTDGDEED